jgi:hypothetical protein
VRLGFKTDGFEPDEESCDFDRNEQDFSEEKNLPKPHANP